MRPSIRTAASLLALSIALAACSSKGEPRGLEACTKGAPTVTVTGELGTKPSVELPGGDPPCDLVIQDLKPGTGDEAIAGSMLSMQYLGVSWSTGETFDASWDRAQPFDFALGSGQVIAGWDEGILGMAAGGRRLLVIPPDKAYGETGQGGIAPNETLVFVVDLLKVTQPEPPPPCDEAEGAAVDVTGNKGAKPTVTIADGDPPCDLQITDLVEGAGAEATAGSMLSMQYLGVSWSTGETFDASWDRAGSPFEFTLGQGQVIRGWDQGIEGMKVGGRRLLVIPPDLGYGAQGAGGAIGPNETLVFVVDLESVG